MEEHDKKDFLIFATMMVANGLASNPKYPHPNTYDRLAEDAVTIAEETMNQLNAKLKELNLED